MRNKLARIIFSVLIPITIFAAPKKKETIELKVVSSKTKIHNSPPGSIFIYTDIMFTEVNGRRLIYECVQRGKICPSMESGKIYTADRERNFIYISMTSPGDKKAFSVKYRQVGSW